MNIFAKVKTVASASVYAFGESLVNAEMLVEEVSFSPKIPKAISWANVAVHAAARNATFALLAKPRDKRVWKIALAANAVSCVTAGICYTLDKDNYNEASLRYIERCLETSDEFANRIIAVKEAA